ncbi:hypothetical protein BDV19DRAFT_386844 [Aspergillus venezuelensis]
MSDPFNFLGIYTENTPVNILQEIDFPPLFPTINTNLDTKADASPSTVSKAESTSKPQAINFGTCPAYNTHGIGIYTTETNFTRPSPGTIREVINWNVAIFVKPISKYWGPTMFYPLRVTDLFELEITQTGKMGEAGIGTGGDSLLFPDPEPYASPIPVPEPWKIGYGTWLGNEGNVMFGLGEIVQVARGAKLAIVEREVDMESDYENDENKGEFRGGKDARLKPTTGFLSLGDRYRGGIDLKFRWF